MNDCKVSAFQTVFPSLPVLFLFCCPSVFSIILCHYMGVEAHPMVTIKHTVKLRKLRLPTIKKFVEQDEKTVCYTVSVFSFIILILLLRNHLT